MNYSSYHPSKKHESGDRTRRIVSSSAPPSVGALEAKISSLKMLRARMTSEDSSPSTELYRATADANVNSINRSGSDKHMQLSHIPMKSASCAPGPIDGGEERSCSTALTEPTSSTSDVDSKGGFDMGVEIFRRRLRLRAVNPAQNSIQDPVPQGLTCSRSLIESMMSKEISE